MLKSIPPQAWILGSASALVLSAGIAVATIRSSNLSVQVANFKLSSTARLNKGLALTRELETQAEKLKAKEIAYQELKTEFDQIKDSNPSFQKLEPKIQRLEDLQIETDLSEVKEELALTGGKIEQEIEDLAVEKENTEDAPLPLGLE